MHQHVQLAAPHDDIHVSQSDQQYPVCGKMPQFSRFENLSVSAYNLKESGRERNHKT